MKAKPIKTGETFPSDSAERWLTSWFVFALVVGALTFASLALNGTRYAWIPALVMLVCPVIYALGLTAARARRKGRGPKLADRSPKA